MASEALPSPATLSGCPLLRSRPPDVCPSRASQARGRNAQTAASKGEEGEVPPTGQEATSWTRAETTRGTHNGRIIDGVKVVGDGWEVVLRECLCRMVRRGAAPSGARGAPAPRRERRCPTGPADPDRRWACAWGGAVAGPVSKPCNRRCIVERVDCCGGVTSIRFAILYTRGLDVR